jgi:GTP-binding protein Era
MTETNAPTRAGFVTLAGAPNAGKSTLLNQLVGTKVSIVSPKVQTTRARVTGIALHNNAQIVFVDTPGIFQPKRRLEKAMVDAAWGGVDEGDMTVLLIDAQRHLTENVERILDGMASQKRKIWVALNKIDIVKKDNLLELAHALGERDHVERIFMLSALTGDGASDLIDALAEEMPEGPWLYPEDQISEMPNRLLAAEIMREKLFLRMHQELPYALTVETEAWEEKKDGSVKISQVIYVTRDSHKAMVLGKGGKSIRQIGQMAREELSELLDRQVHLFTFVKVREKWLDDPARYREMGLDFPKS